MDSVLTLVNPSPPIHLEFDRNSVTNAILLKNSQPTYTIRTKQKTRSARTDVVDIKEIFPDMVTIASVNGGNSVKINKWMKEEQLLDKTRVKVIETAYGRYLWKLHLVHRLALYGESNLETPIAYLQPVTRTSPLVLVIESEAIALIDQIIASFIIREKELRAKEKSSALAAGMLTAAASPMMTGSYLSPCEDAIQIPIK
ncbi:hypothetical protein IW261DRAFT_1423278 [Armillaria novae-zelandiae]|uniref:DUF6593 domain-containing protein n=1 Tax=Armillaria novae-zelandiae TaxID=153914 RepID=A0AA39NXW8_9AGAR|nr:hypothetical protein IW261DRAFT_1423278 [Armillaria novae-zelandiae]